jgi:glycosyltransferase involved in cell wall biosynthesis
VITTPANGFAEILEPGTHGAVVPEGDASALAGEMEKWRDPQARATARPLRLARAAEFSIERNAKETVRILESLLPG